MTNAFIPFMAKLSDEEKLIKEQDARVLLQQAKILEEGSPEVLAKRTPDINLGYNLGVLIPQVGVTGAGVVPITTAEMLDHVADIEFVPSPAVADAVAAFERFGEATGYELPRTVTNGRLGPRPNDVLDATTTVQHVREYFKRKAARAAKEKGEKTRAPKDFADSQSHYKKKVKLSDEEWDRLERGGAGPSGSQ